MGAVAHAPPLPAPFVPSTENSRRYRSALGQFATGITVVTCAGDDGPLGITANSFASVSLEPPLILWSLAKNSRRYAPFVAASHFAVHVLREHDLGVCHRFSVKAWDFDGIDLGRGLDNIPIMECALAVFECAAHALHDAGDHSLVIGAVRQVTARSGKPLIFHGGHYGGFANTEHHDSNM